MQDEEGAIGTRAMTNPIWVTESPASERAGDERPPENGERRSEDEPPGASD